MSRKTKDIRIGLFVLTAAGLLVAGLLAFGLRDVFEKHNYFETYVPGEVTGLSVGSAVLLHGVPVGKVTQISFTWTEYPGYRSHAVLVVAEINPGIFPGSWEDQKRSLQAEIDGGLRARIQGQGITGTSVVALEHVDPKRFPPLSVPWEPRHFYIPSAPGQFKDIVLQVETVLEKLAAIDFPGLGASANNLLGELRLTNDKIKLLLDQTATALASGNIPELMETADRTLAQLRQTAASLNDTIGDLQRYPAGFLLGTAPPRPECLKAER